MMSRAAAVDLDKMWRRLGADVVVCARKLAASGLVRATQGNVSTRDTASGVICVTPSGMDYDVMSAADTVLLDSDGMALRGARKPTTELPTHVAVYRARRDVQAIIHAHAPHATAFAVAHRPIPLVLEEAALCLGAPVRVAPFAVSATPQFAELVVRELGGDCAVLWGNHGLLVAGPSLRQTYAMAHAVEDNAQAYLLASQLGTPRQVPDDAVARLHQFWLDAYGQPAVALGETPL